MKAATLVLLMRPERSAVLRGPTNSKNLEARTCRKISWRINIAALMNKAEAFLACIASVSHCLARIFTDSSLSARSIVCETRVSRYLRDSNGDQIIR